MTRHTSPLALSTLLLCFAVACGPGGEDPAPDDTKTEPLDMSNDASVDMPEEQPDLTAPDMAKVEPEMMCPRPEQSTCGKLCTDLETDVKHCGECNNACGSGSSCLDGDCICFATGRTWCGAGSCVDINADRRHCGECGNACPSASYCDQGTCTDDGVLGEVIALTNQARMSARDCGGTWMEAVGPLSNNAQLAEAAQKHAEDMAARNYFEHDAPPPNASTPTERMRAAGYMGSTTGENIAAGQDTAAIVVQAWIDSPGHCRNMMSPGYNEIGIGFHPEGRQQPYWVQNFGRQ